MIYEYALEPDLVVDWAVNEISRFVPHFGLNQRRLVSDFPEDWRGRVVGALYARFKYDDSAIGFQNAQNRLQAYAEYFCEHMVLRGVGMSADADWQEEAIKEHKRFPFTGVIARSTPPGAPPEWLVPADLDGLDNPRWNIRALDTTPKTPEAIATALHGLLTLSTKVIFIDPYFDAGKARFRSTLSELLKIVYGAGRPCPAPAEIHLYTSVEKRFGRDEERTEIVEKRVAADILQKCSDNLPTLIPKGCTLSVTVLKEKSGSDRLHNRFVLTDVGGAILPHGTDQEDDPARNTQDDILSLPAPMHRTRWREYVTRIGFDVVAVKKLYSG